MEIKDKLTVTRREGGAGENGGKKGQVNEHVKGPWTRTMGRDCLWEPGLDGAEEARRGKMGTTATEQQQKNKEFHQIIIYNHKKWKY